MRSAHKRLLAAHSIDDLRNAAAKVLPRMVFDFLDGAAQSESTMRANRAAFERWRLVGSAPVDVRNRALSINLLGLPARMPLIIGPTGYASAFWPRGDLALARSAARFGIPFVMSYGANASLEDVAAATTGRLWLNLYLSTAREQTLRLLRKAADLRVEAIQVTVDTAVPGRRLRDIRNGFGLPLKWTLGKLCDVLRHPGWMLRALSQGTPRPGLIDVDFKQGSKWATISEFVRSQINPSITWDDLSWLRDQWKGRLIIKGLVDSSQMPKVLAAGYDAVVVSNHGGRQLDGAVSTLEVLPEFVAAAGGRIPVLIDGGLRSGTDILKALALGATAVQSGRATLYGLSVGGEAGVDRALSILRLELDIAMALTGLTQVTDAGPKLLRQSFADDASTAASSAKLMTC